MCVFNRHVSCVACVLLAGLFHRGISQSGTALCTWAFAANGSSEHQAKKLASLLDCPTNPNADLVQCLRTKDAVDIIATDKQFMVGLKDVPGIIGIAYSLNTSCFVVWSLFDDNKDKFSSFVYDSKNNIRFLLVTMIYIIFNEMFTHYKRLVIKLASIVAHFLVNFLYGSVLLFAMLFILYVSVFFA